MFDIGSPRHEWPGISKLIEESGEVAQICGKLMATRGRAEHWDGSDLRARLTEELADLQAAILFVVEAGPIDPQAVQARTERKLAVFREWHASASRPPG